MIPAIVQVDKDKQISLDFRIRYLNHSYVCDKIRYRCLLVPVIVQGDKDKQISLKISMKGNLVLAVLIVLSVLGLVWFGLVIKMTYSCW